MDVYEQALMLHEKNRGKLAIQTKVPCENAEDLSLAYTPGVARPCQKIKEDEENSFIYTNRANTVAVITDGSAVLGLGNIGAVAGLPVMEGKCLLFKRFADIDAFPICLKTQDPDEIINICKNLEPGLGGINLEDISAPRCVKIEQQLIKEMNIPVFHDDQHGTAIVVLAALINATRLMHKDPGEYKVVVSGTGAAGSSIIKTLFAYGFKDILAFDIDGCLNQDDKDSYNDLKKELLDYVNLNNEKYASLQEGIKGRDIFIGVSAPNLLTKDMFKTMSSKPIIFAMANPVPEISYEDAKAANAYIIGTGRSDYPNQINNILAFPGIFRGALDAKATKITNAEKIAASKAIAYLIKDEELRTDYIIPSPFDERVVKAVAKSVKESCIASGNIRK